MFSKTLLVLLGVYFISDYSNGQSDKKFFRNDYTFIEETEAFYKIHRLPTIWSKAKKMCALEGASLFYPENDNEAHAVISYLNNTQSKVYVGMSCLIVKGLFETVDGKLVSEVYDNWHQGEPNNAGGDEDCVVMKQDGTLNDCPCTIEYPFICKKSLRSLEWNKNCNMPDLDYSFVETVGKCYKFHRTPLNWFEAYVVCSAEQSHLAVINSQLEADSLVGLTEIAPNYMVKGNYLRGIYHLGFHNKFDEGWRTVKGTPLNEYDNAWWNNYYPICADHDQCGAMFYDGHLTHIHCDTKCFFICEQEVDSSVKEVFDYPTSSDVSVFDTFLDLIKLLHKTQWQ